MLAAKITDLDKAQVYNTVFYMTPKFKYTAVFTGYATQHLVIVPKCPEYEYTESINKQRVALTLICNALHRAVDKYIICSRNTYSKCPVRVNNGREKSTCDLEVCYAFVLHFSVSPNIDFSIPLDLTGKLTCHNTAEMRNCPSEG